MTTLVPAPQDPLEHADVGPVRHVDDAVGVEGEQRVDVVGGGEADRISSRQGAGIDPDLVRAVGEHADELEPGVVEDRPQGRGADDPGGPLHDPDRVGPVAVHRSLPFVDQQCGPVPTAPVTEPRRAREERHRSRYHRPPPCLLRTSPCPASWPAWADARRGGALAAPTAPRGDHRRGGRGGLRQDDGGPDHRPGGGVPGHLLRAVRRPRGVLPGGLRRPTPSLSRR